MIQLILDVEGQALALPESQKGGYDIREEPLMEDIQMISGRNTREYRGEVWVITHQTGYLSDADKDRFISACRKGQRQSILCSFLQQGASELQTSKFMVTSYRPPKFMWSRIVTEDGTEKTIPVWADYSVSLREVKPHA